MDYKERLDLNKVRQLYVKNIFTRSNLPCGGYSVNPYVGCLHNCVYCYAQCMPGLSEHTSDSWGTFLDVKYWDRIPAPIARNYNGTHVMLSSVTDPYLPLEEHFTRTQSFLEDMVDSNCILTIVTKSDLALRDLDLLTRMDNALVVWSINTLSEECKDAMDTAVSIERRLKVMEKFHNAGVRTGCFIAPIIPRITDVTGILDAVKNICDTVWLDVLNLQSGNKSRTLGVIAKCDWDAWPICDRIFRAGDMSYWNEMHLEVRSWAKEHNSVFTRRFYNGERPPKGSPYICYFYGKKK